jgi:hypothetical protein
MLLEEHRAQWTSDLASLSPDAWLEMLSKIRAAKGSSEAGNAAIEELLQVINS